MYVHKKKYSTKNILIASACGVFFVVAVALALEKMNIINLFHSSPATPQEQESKINADAKKDFLEKGPGATSSEGTPSTNDSASNPQKKIEVNARQEVGSSVTVLTKLFGYGGGTCTLLISNSGKNITQTAKVIYQPDFSSCAGFSVPIEQLGNGSWSILITVHNPDGTTESKRISLEVK